MLLSSIQSLVYIIILVSFSILLFASIHLYLNVVFYCTCILTSISSLITEAVPSGALAFSILSLIFIVAAIVFSGVIVWLGFGIGRKEEVDVFEKLMNTRLFRFFYRGQNAEPVTRSAAKEIEMKHMVVDKGEDEEFTDEDVYGLNDEGNESDGGVNGNQSHEELCERLQEYRPYLPDNKAEVFLALIDQLQESHNNSISSTSSSTSSSSAPYITISSSSELNNLLDALYSEHSQCEIDNFRAVLATLHRRQSTSTHHTSVTHPNTHSCSFFFFFFFTSHPSFFILFSCTYFFSPSSPSSSSLSPTLPSTSTPTLMINSVCTILMVGIFFSVDS